MAYSIIAKGEDYRAEVGDTIAANTSAGPWTLTLPATAGELVVLDQLRTWGQHPLSIDAIDRIVVMDLFDEQQDDFVSVDRGILFETSDFQGHVLTFTRGEDFDAAQPEPWHCKCKRMITSTEAREEHRAIAIEAAAESERMREGEREFLAEVAVELPDGAAAQGDVQ